MKPPDWLFLQKLSKLDFLLSLVASAELSFRKSRFLDSSAAVWDEIYVLKETTECCYRSLKKNKEQKTEEKLCDDGSYKCFCLCQHVTHLFTHQNACRTDAAACFTEQKLSGILQPGRKNPLKS